MGQKTRQLRHIVDYDTEVVLSYDDNTTERFWDFSRALRFLDKEGFGHFRCTDGRGGPYCLEFDNKQKAWYHASVL